MNTEELKAKTVDELHKLLLDTRKAQMNMRFQRTSGQLEKTSEIRKSRRLVAQIKTFMAIKKNAEAAGEKPAAPKKKATAAKTKTKAA